MLAFDTTQGACSAAVARGGILLSQQFEIMARGQAERLIPMIEAVRQQAGVEHGEINLIAVTVGPGTFTGVRVGLAAARALALVHEQPVLGIGTLELLARSAMTDGNQDGDHGGNDARNDDCVIAAIDARRGELYVQAFGADGSALAEAAAITAAAYRPPPNASPGRIVGTGAAILQAMLPDWRVDDRVIQPDAAILARAAEGWRQRAGPTPPAPFYLRAPDAKLPAQATDVPSR